MYTNRYTKKYKQIKTKYLQGPHNFQLTNCTCQGIFTYKGAYLGNTFYEFEFE